MKRASLALVPLILLWSMAGRSRSAELVVNGGFETGGYTGWTKGGDTRYDDITSAPFYVHGGTYAAQFAGLGRDAQLSQNLATTPGLTYQVSYWLLSDGMQPNDFSVSFGGQTLFSQSSLPAFDSYMHYTYNVEATAPTSTLLISARDDPGYFYLDDVSVQQTVAPEPASLTLLGIAGASLGSFTWLRRGVRTTACARRLERQTKPPPPAGDSGPSPTAAG